MLKLENITKDYVLKNIEGRKSGTQTTQALKGVSVEFRESEFVAILGPSGCGKTTLLNIIGGLDRYTSGDLFINNVSTKTFKDRDWDTYRNHSVGFVFQSYNLIEHQSILSNVSLALTMSGLDKAECKARALAALEKVGLAGQEHKKPNQLSGGQMQRVAIARAIVNNPDIILADEPTGALDSDTSIQIMDILKELSKENLIIMVTHNPELAAQYATRIVKLSDGLITGDSNPYTAPEYVAKNEDSEFLADNADENVSEAEKQRRLRLFKRKKQKEKCAKERERRKKEERSSMKYESALKLSASNLVAKRGRTILTSVAGSVGIIGITLVLALSSGFGAYTDKIAEDALSSYPLTITQTSFDMMSVASLLFNSAGGTTVEDLEEHKDDTVYVSKFLGNLLENMDNLFSTNDTAAFKKYLDANWDDKLGFVKYSYGTEMYIYSDYSMAGDNYSTQKENGDYFLINPFIDRVLTSISGLGLTFDETMMNNVLSFANSITAWDELVDNQTLLDSQYELLGSSRWPQNENEVILVVDGNNSIIDYMLFTIGLKAPGDVFSAISPNSGFADTTYDIDSLLGVTYKVLPRCDYIVKQDDGTWIDYAATNSSGQLIHSDNSPEVKELINSKARELSVVGVVRPTENTTAGAINGVAAYTSALTDSLIENAAQNEFVQAQIASWDSHNTQNLITGMSMSADQYKDWLSKLGLADLDCPETIYLYASSFEAKDGIIALIDKYNEQEDVDDIMYSDSLGLLMSTMTTILNSITYILIGFSAISLIVSSIMIAIVIYTSVLERTKEIGVLRSLGARKKDIARVFNSEAIMIGFISGAIGVLFTFIMQYPVSAILKNMIGIGNLMSLVWWHAILMIVLSMFLSMIAGIIPAQLAANKDPVTALRSD